MHSLKKYFLLFVFSANLAAIVYIWWTGSSGSMITDPAPGNQVIAVGRFVGLLLEYFLLMQLVLMGRIPWLEEVWGHDGLNRIHRLSGYTIGSTMLLHPLLLTIGYSQQSELSWWQQFIFFITDYDDVLKAVLAISVLVVIVIMSAFLRKRLRYETWYFTHLLTYLAVFLAFDHQVKLGDFIGRSPLIGYWYVLALSAGGLVILFRFLRPLNNFRIHRFEVMKVTSESGNVRSIYIQGSRLAKFTFQPGQFANLTFLRQGLWFTHPFSFSAPPNGEYLRFSVKALGDFTNKIDGLLAGTPVIIDGPLGVFTQERAVLDKYLFIAGGIGITPIRALVESLAVQGKDVVLLHGNKNAQEIVFEQEIVQLAKRYHLIVSEVVEHASGTYLTGRIDRQKIEALAPDFLQRDAYVCGPPPMMDGIIKMLLDLGMPRQQIHFEKFSY